MHVNIKVGCVDYHLKRFTEKFYLQSVWATPRRISGIHKKELVAESVGKLHGAEYLGWWILVRKEFLASEEAEWIRARERVSETNLGSGIYRGGEGRGQVWFAGENSKVRAKLLDPAEST